jgi:hypothetical protein
MKELKSSDMQAELGIKEETIDGHRFEIKLLPCGPAGELFIEIMDIIGPGLGTVVDKMQNYHYIEPEDNTAFTEVINTFTSKLARGNYNTVLDIVLEGCLIDGVPFDRNKHLRGKFGTYVSLVKLALEANFSDFFTGVLRDMGLEIPTLSGLMATIKEMAEERQSMTQAVSEDLENESQE